MIIQYRDVTGFDAIVFRGPGTLDIVQADVDGLCIEAAAEHLGQIQSKVIAGKLYLGVKYQKVIDFSAYHQPITYRLQVREITSLEVSACGVVHMPDIDRDEFQLKLSDRADVTLEQLTADRLDLTLRDKARLTVSGDIEHQAVSLAGLAKLDASNVISDTASVRLLDQSQAVLRINDELDAYLSTGTSLTYIGYPEVQKQGGGALIRRRKQFAKPIHSQKGS